jgi:hypothetical protein
MNGALPAPLIAPGDAGKLLDEIIYERVLSCIDVDALLTFECELSSAFDECDFDGDPAAPDLAKEMIDRAMHRAREERWEAHLRGSRSCDSLPWDCELCEEAPVKPSATPKPTKRKSS